MGELGKVLMVLGAVLFAAGLALFVLQKLPFSGRLPGDILVKRGNVTFYFPLATSIIVSILLSVILYLINKFR